MALSMASSSVSATSTNRVIALVDMDGFYVQVEERDNPALKGIPAAVVQYNKDFKGGGIIAINYEARAKGVSRNMRWDAAKALCPEIQLVRVPETQGKADLTKYRNAGEEVIKILTEFSSCVERASVDEAYIDLTEAVEVRLAELSSQETFSSWGRGERILESLDVEAFSTNYILGHDSTTSWFDSIKGSESPSIDDIKLAIGAEIVGKMREDVFQKTQFRCSAGIAHNKVDVKLVCGINKPNKQTIFPNASVPALWATTKIGKVSGLGGKLGDRRDTTSAPKTTEEKQDAIREEMEEKHRINSLPPDQNNYGGGGYRDDRSGGSRLPGGQSRKKRSESSTLPGNKASKNSVEKPEPSGSTGNPVFGPPSWGSNWGQRNQSEPPGSSQSKSAYNKLAPDNFEKLVSEFMALPLEDNDEHISSFISVVFENAIDEPSFSAAYAKLVQTVCKTSQETSKKFRKQILDQCQREFQKSNTDEAEIKEIEQKLQEATEEEEKKQLKLEIDEKKFTGRRRSLGNVRFIGELYKLQMLTPKIMVECVHLLLYAPDDENLERLCILLSTVGQRLGMHLKSIEEQAARGEKLKFCPEPKWMDKAFSMLQQLSESEKLSSGIRFGILDVVELRQNNWKPRRDTNAPKTTEEVRQDAIPQEMEEKRRINSRPPVQNNYGRTLPGGQPQKKGSEWSTLPANKASRIQKSAKKPEPSGSSGNPVFGPPSWGSNWGQRNQSGPPGSSQSKSLYPKLPTRLQANTNRISNLAQSEGPKQPNESMPNPVFSPPSWGSNWGQRNQSGPPGSSQSKSPYPNLPPRLQANSNRFSNLTQDDGPKQANKSMQNSSKDEAVTADTGESVKNIFQEYLSYKKFDDTLHWIKKRFPGNKIDDFIDEISRQMSVMSKEEEQKCAGSLVRLLIKDNQIPKEAVLRVMAQGVMKDLPDILIDSPMATSYLAQFLVEMFAEDNNLDWLVQVGDNLIESEKGDSAWKLLAVNSLNLFKLRKNEEFVQTSFGQTERKNGIPIDEIPWLQDQPIDTLTGQMAKMLSPMPNSQSSDGTGPISQVSQTPK